MGSGFSKMKKQARMMQEQFGQVREKMQNTLVEGSAGNGLVKITLNGEKDIKKLAIQPECVSDIEGLQDLIIAAFEDAASKIQSNSAVPSMPGFGF
ncbi:MAG: YbaB/EbfC family nucleoid-associated protein [Verrucomicrobia bacterium]|nr:YbaB/EbfC family nucleoid-associated protein [Verrucomicrobiota bacterium]